jgi:hypothetical protein
MRDVMEIEFLLREFVSEPSNISVWLSCSPQERHNQFRPAILRQREARRRGVQTKDLSDSTDYRGHSELLHVTPYHHPIVRRGLIEPSEFFFGDALFAEIFEHGRRLLFEAHRLRRKLAAHAKSPLGPRQGLKKVRDAWQRTRELQAVWSAILEVSRNRKAAEDPDTAV